MLDDWRGTGKQKVAAAAVAAQRGQSQPKVCRRAEKELN